MWPQLHKRAIKLWIYRYQFRFYLFFAICWPKPLPSSFLRYSHSEQLSYLYFLHPVSDLKKKFFFYMKWETLSSLFFFFHRTHYTLHSHHSKTLILHSPKLIERTSAQHTAMRLWGGVGVGAGRARIPAGSMLGVEPHTRLCPTTWNHDLSWNQVQPLTDWATQVPHLTH